jgi:sensor histidine kinase YesM
MGIYHINWLKYKFTFLLLVCSIECSFALDTLTITSETYKTKGSYNLLRDSQFTFNTAREKLLVSSNKSYVNYGRIFRSYNSYWVGIVLKNPTSQILYLNAEAYFDSVWINSIKQPSCKYESTIDPHGVIRYPQTMTAFLKIEPGSHIFLSKISDFHLQKNFTPVISNSYIFEKENFEKEKIAIYYLIFLSGIFFILLIAAFFSYIKLKDLTFLFYGLFCFNFFIHFNRSLGEKSIPYNWISQLLPWVYIKMLLFFLFYFAYLMFVNYFLDTKNKYPDIYKISILIIKSMIVLAIPEIILLYNGYLTESYTYYFSIRFIINLLSFYSLYKLWKFRSNIYVQLMMIGGISLLLADISTSLFDNSSIKLIALLLTAIDVVVFTLAIVYKLNDSQRQKIALQSEYDKQQNEILQLNLEKSQLNLTLLQSQMNPHFIFNALNSIKFHILNLDNDKASYYLSKFSKLVRSVLDHSSRQTILLAKEIETLNLYLEIEALRFDDNFTYSINISEEVETDMIEVPPHIIQPYAENAILHGFESSNKDNKLTIHIYENENNLIIEIIDNGIGRLAASSNQLKAKAENHEPMGLKITEERIQQYGILKNKITNLEIIDLFNNKNQSIGTKVILSL